MVTIRYADGKGWHDARVEARAPIPMDPATAVLHYAQEIFEGLKAYRRPTAGSRCSGPEANARRFRASAARMAMPELPGARCSWSRWSELVEIDREWIPTAEEGSLYLRPFMFASEVFLGVRPAREYLYLRHRLAGRRVLRRRRQAGHASGSRAEYTRAAPGGTGAAKCGGNYAASLVAQAEAIEHGCDQVVFLDAVERRYVDELGGMNIFFVYDDGTLVTPPLTGTILPGHHPRLGHRAGRATPAHEVVERPVLGRGVAGRRGERPAARGVRLRHGRGHHADRHRPASAGRVHRSATAARAG